ncbi:hypothetical protein PO909_008973 [Leuciscus waleckii]
MVPRGVGDRSIVLDVSPGNHSLWAPHSSLPPQPVESPVERAGPSVMGGLAVSPEAPPEDRMPIAASEGELASGDGLDCVVSIWECNSSTALRRQGADGGHPIHPAPAARCCLHPSVGGRSSACPSPGLSPCGRLRSRRTIAAASTQVSKWSRQQKGCPARSRRCQARW